MTSITARNTIGTGRTGRRLAVLAGVCLSGLFLTACNANTENRQLYDGFYFPAKTKAVDKKTARDRFVTEIQRASQSEKGARQAAHHSSTAYCIENYGTSQILWDQDPTDLETPLTFDKDTLVLMGTCNP
jgi:hypothetical protein